jgi:two-component system response regulator GlrR
MTTSTQTGNSHLLIVDDDADHLVLVQRWLQRAGFSAAAARSGEHALALLEQHRPDLVITDLVMTGMDGIRLLREIHRHDPVMPVILMSGQAGIAEAVEATHLGACTFLAKPIERDRLVSEVKEALRLNAGNRQGDQGDFGHRVIHRSQLMAELLGRARLVAGVDTTVLITGETGTGKEILAEAIHEASPRREAPFVAINCSALPEELLESELFGHEKGAFTGAAARHEGLFQAADGGTLFLDEVGDMPAAVQAKLLRVLQDFKVRPVGSTRSFSVNVRIIAATHHDLERRVELGDFREDLFYRLSVVPLHMPGLRERREDIPLLVDHFLRRTSERTGKPPKRFSPEAMRQLLAADLPGNVRQLQNLVEQCSILSPSDIISLPLTLQALREKPSSVPTLDEARQAFDRRYLIGILRTADGNVTAAARMAGRNRTEFYKLLSRYELDPTRFRSDRRLAGDRREASAVSGGDPRPIHEGEG